MLVLTTKNISRAAIPPHILYLSALHNYLPSYITLTNPKQSSSVRNVSNTLDKCLHIKLALVFVHGNNKAP